ncbi:MAG: cyclic nucleotide-binding domain-containing protein [Labilithrix sp.]|nr:cyclic nucleotide-binding domain-containing protein [Labilithrix sp.]MCW5836283.1 cyclic nucleotide-binding domain-containing protein [Labilithrix sp.]
MSDERIKDLPANVPERARVPRDATIVLPPPAFGPSSSTAIDSVAPVPLDSYQPPNTGTAALSTSPSPREQIVPSAATVGSVLEHIRKPTVERLEVEARLASGGMGSIDVVIDHALDRRIAIKTLHPHLRSDDQTVRMFLREARLTGLLDHPHIVPVYDLGERESGELFFAMKLVEGQTLAALIRALPRGVLDTATLYTLLDVFAKVCDALAFAHSRGVLHCDVKPANVMVGEFGQVFLMDWGIARLVVAEGAPASQARSGGADEAAPPRRARPAQSTDNSIIGTPGYMSPEQARGDRKKLDVRSDVFLLGALLYEILTHRPPYASSDKSETLALAAAGAFPSPRKVAGELAVPLELERIVLRAMARSPEERYPSVAALKEDLVRFMRGGAEFPRRTFRAGEAIVREGEPGDAAYIIVEGRCEIRKETPTGTQTLHTIEPGAVFGEMAILTQGPRTATVIAVEPTTVLVVTSHDLEHEMAALKPWMATLLKSLASRFRDVDTHSRATYPATLSPARVANQVLMNLETWGEADGRGGRWMRWTELAPELEAQLGLPSVALFGAIARYGLALDVEGDRLTLADPAALRERLERDLGHKPRA